MNIMFNIVPIFMVIIFIVMFSLIISQMVKTSKQAIKNNNSPVLTVNAKVVTKRTNVNSRHSMNENSMNNMLHDTDYYVTFQVDSGDRMEFHVTGDVYGMMAESDVGNLTFQGTRYLKFERKIY
ncbi:Protein of unknown function [Hathewaya proteolytica DSM 3090]|uniref:DUF2500 domain-containing protein n=1 Tax=Hathewaya proteolytica DSM 3090 TaxID=1121331 RepID=A0A1M6KK00_9CLOT|nr:DUF2500 domain-containing protein [Hathewaya proteolytica]SHJ59292.1 Protein of unknown function [Hathewaya proteolytica DSM 3090]